MKLNNDLRTAEEVYTLRERATMLSYTYKIYNIYIPYHLLIFTIFLKYVELSAFSKDVANFNTLVAEAGALTARITKVSNKPTSTLFKSAHTTVIYFPKKYINIILAFTSSSSKCL